MRPTIVAPGTPGEFCAVCGQTGTLRTIGHQHCCPIIDRPTAVRLLEVGTRAYRAEEAS